ncbi:MAG: hypothetical protein BRD50_07670 [Bacteroidetes bacterium SW_11_45_7]|nr:MAG: hypothetical protein BRD50_07670 [Bacteroidetes bacterium SW_11_45_7]
MVKMFMLMKHKPTLFIEGDSNLKKGFKQLISKEIKKKFSIKMGEGKHTTIRKFKHDKLSSVKFLLIDLDGAESKKPNDITANSLTEFSERSFYMIQKMEGWFLSQPEKLDSHWQISSFSSIQKHGKEFPDPDNWIDEQLKKYGKRYHKTRDPIDILANLDIERLKSDFEEVKELVDSMHEQLRKQ